MSSFVRTLGWCALWIGGPALAVEPHDQWYATVVQGHVAGWMHDVWTHADGQWISDQEMRMEIARGDQVVTTLTRMTLVETDDGAPVRMDVTASNGTAGSSIHVGFADGVATVTVTAGDRVTTSTQVLKPGCLTPIALRQELMRRLDAGELDIALCALNVVSPGGGTTMRYAVTGAEPFTDDLGTEPSTRVVFTTEAAPGVPTTEWIAADGRMLRTDVAMGAIDMVVRRTDGPVTLDAPVEMMVRTFVPLDAPIPNARSAQSASFRVGMKNGALPPMPDTSAQRVTVDASGARVDLDLQNLTPAVDGGDPRWTARTLIVDTSDPKLAELVDQALRKVRRKDSTVQAETLRRFVYDYIEHKDLSVAFGSASEVARGRRGDCTEHAVLLAGLLRVAGVPARVASGLVYTDTFMGEDQVFVFHMWAQALLPVDGQPTWVDLDAAISPTATSDATHIALALSGLEDGALLSTFASIVRVLGELTIEVLPPQD